MPSTYTKRQGQFLAFIHQYTAFHDRPPSEAELGQYFQVTAPSVHSMILMLERRRLIIRTPGQPRSIRLALPLELLPPLPGKAEAREPQLSGSVRAEDQPLSEAHAAVLRLGKMQFEALFVHIDRHPFDDSEFLPLLDTLIAVFAHAGLSAFLVDELRRHVCELYHHACHAAAPKFTREKNVELMLNYLPPSKRNTWRAAISQSAAS